MHTTLTLQTQPIKPHEATNDPGPAYGGAPDVTVVCSDVTVYVPRSRNHQSAQRHHQQVMESPGPPRVPAALTAAPAAAAALPPVSCWGKYLLHALEASGVPLQAAHQVRACGCVCHSI